MTADKVYYLSKVDFLSDLTTWELTELAGEFQWEEYAKGSAIIKQGQEQHRFYVLTEGRAEALVSKEGQNSWQVNSFGPGDAFGEISLFTGNAAPTTVRCLEKCLVLTLDSGNFAHMLLRWPKLYTRFIEKLSHSLNKVNYVLWEAKHKEFLRSALQLTQYEDKFYGLWGSVKTTKEVETKLTELARTKEYLLLIGERGTGRQMMAWFLHKRRCGEGTPFVVVDGRHFDQQWGDSILDSSSSFLGSDGGQFMTHEGQAENVPEFRTSSLLDIAEGGTLLIREINLISPRSQLKLAQLINSRKTRCLIVGTLLTEPELLEQRLIPELRECFAQTYKITPLRERKRDIPVLAHGILDKLARKHHRQAPMLDKEAVKLLLSHNYGQGNVTELIQVVERAFFLAENNIIGLEHIFFGPTAEKIGSAVNLLSWQWIENLFKESTFILWIRRLTAGAFFLIILILLLAPQITVTKKVFTLVWGLWWPALAIISPFLGRIWCTVCPFSFLMEFVQRKLHLNRPVPDVIKKYDYLFVSFLFLLIFWIEIITEMRSHPGYTVVLLISIQAAAIGFGIIFTRHTWCHYLCPLGGFVGTASIGAMLEVRADATVCLNKCTTHDCYVGHGNVSGCPMSQHLPYLDNNLGCKLCFNCVRNCPNGAVQFHLRVPAREVWHLVRVNQGFAVFIGVTLAILIPINYFEPLQKAWPISQWRLWFSLAYWGAAFIAGMLIWLIARPFKTKAASRRTKLVFAFIPLVLAGHIIYQLHFLPGADALMLGMGLKSPSGNTQAFFVPVYIVGQSLAFMIGAIFTSLTVMMVFWHSKEKRAGRSVSVKQAQANESFPPENIKVNT